MAIAEVVTERRSAKYFSSTFQVGTVEWNRIYARLQNLLIFVQFQAPFTAEKLKKFLRVILVTLEHNVEEVSDYPLF
jgi:hypothetical protein